MFCITSLRIFVIESVLQVMIFQRGHFKSNRIQKSALIEILNESRAFSASSFTTTKVTVFLSHKHNDLVEEEDVKGFIEILDNQGVKVYIDSMDNTLPAQTTGDTASRIKGIIKNCRKFIFLATEKAIESYWCNWELGIGDVHKYKNHIAIVPIKEKGQLDHQYKGKEYLQIYPHVDYENGTGIYRDGRHITAGYYVVEYKNNDGIRYLTSLASWLKS